MATRKKEREQLEELAAFIGRHADGVAVDDIVVGIKLPISTPDAATTLGGPRRAGRH